MNKKPAKKFAAAQSIKNPEHKFYLINLLNHPIYIKVTAGTAIVEGSTEPATLIYLGLDEEQIKKREPQLEYLAVPTEKNFCFSSPIAKSSFIFVDTEDPSLNFSRVPFIDEENNVYIHIFKHEPENGSETVKRPN